MQYTVQCGASSHLIQAIEILERCFQIIGLIHSCDRQCWLPSKWFAQIQQSGSLKSAVTDAAFGVVNHESAAELTSARNLAIDLALDQSLELRRCSQFLKALFPNTASRNSFGLLELGDVDQRNGYAACKILPTVTWEAPLAPATALGTYNIMALLSVFATRGSLRRPKDVGSGPRSFDQQRTYGIFSRIPPV